MKLALQLFSVREDLEKDFLGTLKKVKEIGYEGGELAGLYGRSAEEVKAAFAEAGLIPISAHVAYQDLAPDIEGLVKTYSSFSFLANSKSWLWYSKIILYFEHTLPIFFIPSTTSEYFSVRYL